MNSLGLADLVIRPTIVLGVAAVVVLLLRRRSAAARHAVWTAALFGIVLVPALGPLAPRFEVPLSAGVANAVDAVPGLASFRHRDGQSPNAPAPVPGAAGSVGSESMAVPWTEIWLAGVALSLLTLVLRYGRLRGVQARARPVADPALLAVGERARRRLRVGRDVQLLFGDPGAMPMTWGFVSPRILLPPESPDWPEAQTEAVLLHEMAHVRRRDVAFQRCAEVALALFWFHPLAWVAHRRMLAEREHACDDVVLRSGVRGAEYAHQLLAMAHGLRTARGGALALPMARPSQMTGRLLAIMDEGRARRDAEGSSAPAVLAMAVGLAFAVAAVRPVSVAAFDAAALDAADAGAGGCWHPIGPNSNHNKNEDPGLVTASWRTERCSGSLQVLGRVVVAADSSGFVSVDPGASVSISEREGDTWRRIEIRGRADRQPIYGGRFAGEQASFELVDTWLASNLRPMLRFTGVEIPVAGSP